MSGFIRQVWLVLALAVGLGSSLAAIDGALKPRIEANAKARLEVAIFEVVPAGGQYVAEQLNGRTVYRVADQSDQLAGWAVPAETMGFVDKIGMIIGISPDGESILGLVVLQSIETPGLGDNIQTADFRGQYVGMPTSATLEVVKPGQTAEHSIDALTGATISSRAVTNCVNQAVAEVRGTLMASTTSGGEGASDE